MINDQVSELRELFNSKIGNFSDETLAKQHAQDEIIDLISCEIFKMSKRKSDELL